MLYQDGTMDNYIKLLQDHRVSHLVCATDQLYKTEELTKSGNSHQAQNTPNTHHLVLQESLSLS